MLRKFDKGNNRLVYILKKATPDFWEKRWDSNNLKKEILNISPLSFVLKYSKKYLNNGDSILEGGCGNGKQVFLLSKNGFDCVGVDFAKKTISRSKNIFPKLRLSFGDLEKLNLEVSQKMLFRLGSRGVQAREPKGTERENKEKNKKNL